MENTQKTYTEFHRSRNPVNIYPSEWVVRTLLGTYPTVAISKEIRPGQKVLDIGFGDGRNMPLLDDIGLDIYGVEITQEIVDLTQKRMDRYEIPVTLKVGSNARLPFDSVAFDYLLACHSCYYVDEGTTFSDNVCEYARVLKPGGWLVASLPEPDSFIFRDSEDAGNGHRRIRKDEIGLRNGYVFRVFQSTSEIRDTFAPYFEQFSFGCTKNDYYGLQMNVFLMVCRRKNCEGK